MTLPNVVRLLFMFPPSRRRVPVAPDVLALSLPAKSTSLKSTLQEAGDGGPESGDFLEGGFGGCAFNEATETYCEDGVTARGSIIHQRRSRSSNLPSTSILNHPPRHAQYKGFGRVLYCQLS